MAIIERPYNNIIIDSTEQIETVKKNAMPEIIQGAGILQNLRNDSEVPSTQEVVTELLLSPPTTKGKPPVKGKAVQAPTPISKTNQPKQSETKSKNKRFAKPKAKKTNNPNNNNQSMLKHGQMENNQNVFYNIASTAPFVVPTSLFLQQEVQGPLEMGKTGKLYFQNEPTVEEQAYFNVMKKECPMWARHISASNWWIAGELATYFTTIRDMMYPRDGTPRDQKAVKKWMDEHSCIKSERYGGRDKDISGGDYCPHSRSNRWYINVRQPRQKGQPYVWEDYMFVSKSLVGCIDIAYDGQKKKPDDQAFKVVDNKHYAKTGYGLFFNRVFFYMSALVFMVATLFIKSR